MIIKQDCLDKLKNISEYKDNWNSYGAAPIDKDLIDECKTIINQVSVYPEIFATANKSIQLEYHGDEIYIEIEMFSDKYALFCEANGKWTEIDLDSISQVIRWWNVLTAIAER